MEALVVGLVLAFVSGLAYIAYRHPSGYAKIWPWVWVVLTVGYIAALTWSFAVRATKNALMQFIESPREDKALVAVNGLELPDLWILGIYLASFFYLFFLAHLPHILGSNDKKTDA